MRAVVKIPRPTKHRKPTFNYFTKRKSANL